MHTIPIPELHITIKDSTTQPPNNMIRYRRLGQLKDMEIREERQGSVACVPAQHHQSRPLSVRTAAPTRSRRGATQHQSCSHRAQSIVSFLSMTYRQSCNRHNGHILLYYDMHTLILREQFYMESDCLSQVNSQARDELRAGRTSARHSPSRSRFARRHPPCLS